MEVSGEHHALAGFTPGKRSRKPSSRWLGGPQRRSGRFGEKCPAPAGNQITILRTYAPQNRDFVVPRLLKEDAGPEYRCLDSRCCSPASHSSDRVCCWLVSVTTPVVIAVLHITRCVYVSFLGVHRVQHRNGTSGRQFVCSTNCVSLLTELLKAVVVLRTSAVFSGLQGCLMVYRLFGGLQAVWWSAGLFDGL